MVAAALSMTDDQRAELSRMATSSTLPHRQVMQARALLWAGDGMANEEIARRSGVDSDVVRRWRSRFAETGLDGVGRIAPGRGRKPSLPEGTVEQVLHATAHDTPPGGATHAARGAPTRFAWPRRARTSSRSTRRARCPRRAHRRPLPRTWPRPRGWSRRPDAG